MRNPIPSVLTILALAVAAPRSGAQFTQFSWTLSNPNGGIGSVDEQYMGLHGLFAAFPGSVVKYTTTASVSGRVGVHSVVMPEDGVCSGGGSAAQYIVGTSGGAYATCNFTGDLSFDVAGGQAFGFGLQTFNTAWPYSTYLSDFTFTPFWTALGGALAGTTGLPTLAGEGILTPGQPIRLALSNAAPVSPAAFIVGLSEVNAPFKGGVMVPAFDILVTGLVTNGVGAVGLDALFPPGVPANVSFTVQAWIQDAAGPAGFAASNAMRGTTL